MFDHLIESSHRDDSNKRSNIGFGEKITAAVLILECLFLRDDYNKWSNIGFGRELT